MRCTGMYASTNFGDNGQAGSGDDDNSLSGTISKMSIIENDDVSCATQTVGYKSQSYNDRRNKKVAFQLPHSKVTHGITSLGYVYVLDK